jgi:hypothetical protein
MTLDEALSVPDRKASRMPLRGRFLPRNPCPILLFSLSLKGRRKYWRKRRRVASPTPSRKRLDVDALVICTFKTGLLW